MSDYPSEIVVGRGSEQATYALRDGLALRFAPSVPEGEIDGIVRAIGEVDPWPVPVPSELHARRRMRLVRSPEPTRELVRFLIDRYRALEDVLPVYADVRLGEASAAAPVPDAVVVRLPDPDDAAMIEELEARKLTRNMAMSPFLGKFDYFRLDTSAGAPDALALLPELEGLGLAPEPDFLTMNPYQDFPDDKEPDDDYWLHQWNLVRIRALGGWKRQLGAQGVVIAVVDSGFQLDHQDLWFTDDLATHLDFEALAEGKGGPYDAGPTADPHGTAVAGIAAARLNNNEGIAGVAGGCPVLPVRIGQSTTSCAIAVGIRWAAHHGARVINLSVAFAAPTSCLLSAVAYAAAKDVVMCACTGNNASPAGSPPIPYPASSVHVIAVGASDRNNARRTDVTPDGIEWGSQYGPELDVVAPGDDLWTTDEIGQAGYRSAPSDDGYYSDFGATSGATPHVAGLAALIRLKDPLLSASQVRYVVARTCQPVGPYTYTPDSKRPELLWTDQMGHGLIDCDAALALVETGGIPSDDELRPPEEHFAPGLVPVCGFIGRGANGRWRIYVSPVLDEYVEIAAGGIHTSDEVPNELAVRYLVWSEAIVDRVHTLAPRRLQVS